MMGQMAQILTKIGTLGTRKERRMGKYLVIKTKVTQILYMVLKPLT